MIFASVFVFSSLSVSSKMAVIFAFVFLSVSSKVTVVVVFLPVSHVCVLKGGCDEANHWLTRSVYWLHLQLLPRKLR